MFFTASTGPAATAAAVAFVVAADVTETFMSMYLGDFAELKDGRAPPSHPTPSLADQFGQLRKVMLFSLAYFSAESSISLRIIFGSFAGSQSLVTIWNLLPSHCIMWNLPAPS